MSESNLSILIPTKDRYFTLFPVVRGLIKDFENCNVEIVIQDNTLNNQSCLTFLSSLNSHIVKYFHSKKSLSQSENCNQAVINSSGKYVLLIGDDDYVSRNIIHSVEWMQENNIDCLNYNFASYTWPNIKFKYSTPLAKGGILILRKPVMRKYTFRNPKIELEKVLLSGGTNYHDLPRIYHGIVCRNTLDKVYKQCGTYFPGLSPDMASSVALSFYVNRFAKYSFPLSISGKSLASNAGKGVNHMHRGSLDDKPFLSKVLLANWDKRIPYFWSGDTIYAQSIISALSMCGSGLQINFVRLHAHLIVYEFQMYKENRESLYTLVKAYPLSVFGIASFAIIFFFRRILNFLVRKFWPTLDHDYFCIESILDADEILVKI